MDKRNVLAVVVAMVFVGLTALIVGGMLSAGASVTPCASYSITAPVVGTKQDTKCSPTALPTLFNTGHAVQHCERFSPVIDVCAAATVYYITP